MVFYKKQFKNFLYFELFFACKMSKKKQYYVKKQYTKIKNNEIVCGLKSKIKRK